MCITGWSKSPRSSKRSKVIVCVYEAEIKTNTHLFSGCEWWYKWRKHENNEFRVCVILATLLVPRIYTSKKTSSRYQERIYTSSPKHSFIFSSCSAFSSVVVLKDLRRNWIMLTADLRFLRKSPITRWLWSVERSCHDSCDYYFCTVLLPPGFIKTGVANIL